MKTMFDIILAHVIARPFRPYRIILKNGQTFDINDPEGVFVGIARITLSRVVLDLPELPVDMFHIPIDSIQSVERLEAPVNS